MKFTLVALAASVLGAPLQKNLFYGHSLEVFTGTPAHRYTLAPDFDSDELRLFAGAESRSPFLAPIAHSVSLTMSASSRLVDNVTVAGFQCAGVPVNLERGIVPRDVFYHGDSDGRIGLGPSSRLTNEKVMTMSPAQILEGGTSYLGFDVTFIDSVPATGAAYTDVAAPVAPRSSGWSLNTRMTLNGQMVAPTAFNVELDPSLPGIMEMSPEGMRRLVAVFARSRPDVDVDPLGRLMLPCDARGVIQVPQEVEILLPGGGSIRLDIPSESGDEPTPTQRGFLCRAGFKARLDTPVWSMNPLYIKNLAAVYFSGATKRVTIRSATDLSFAPMMAVPAVAGVRIPVFDRHAVSVEGGITRIAFAPVPMGRAGPQYVITSMRPDQQPDGTLVYSFTPLSFESMAPSTTELPGLFQFADGPEMKVIPPLMSVTLSLRPATADARGRKFAVQITRSSTMLVVQLSPVIDGRTQKPQLDAAAVRLLEMITAIQSLKTSK